MMNPTETTSRTPGSYKLFPLHGDVNELQFYQTAASLGLRVSYYQSYYYLINDLETAQMFISWSDFLGSLWRICRTTSGADCSDDLPLSCRCFQQQQQQQLDY